jgi:hypothetical protein
VRRFASSWSDRPPAARDEAWADLHLLPGERRLWIRLSNADRRHALEVARRYVGAHPSAGRAEVAGALLHDVGKLASGLGVWGRVAATLVGPRGRRFRAYHDHEALGAELCARAGSAPVTVALVAGRGATQRALREADQV